MLFESDLELVDSRTYHVHGRGPGRGDPLHGQPRGPSHSGRVRRRVNPRLPRRTRLGKVAPRCHQADGNTKDGSTWRDRTYRPGTSFGMYNHTLYRKNAIYH